jgi:hypothetical protein
MRAPPVRFGVSAPSAKWGVHVCVKYAKCELMHFLQISLHILHFFYCIFLHILYREVHSFAYLCMFYCIFQHIECIFTHIFAYLFAHFDTYAHTLACLICMCLHTSAYCLSGSPYVYIFMHIYHEYFGIYLYINCIFKHTYACFMCIY